jgi:hypothetical protein
VGQRRGQAENTEKSNFAQHTTRTKKQDKKDVHLFAFPPHSNTAQTSSFTMASKARGRTKKAADEEEEVAAPVAEDTVEEAVEEESGPMPISKLEGSGITSADVKKLMECGFYTVEAIAYSTRKTLAAVKGMFNLPPHTPPHKPHTII